MKAILLCTFFLGSMLTISAQMLLIDDFDRSDNLSVGNGWTEIDDSNSDNNVMILSQILNFKPAEVLPGLTSSYCYRSLENYIHPVLSANPQLVAWNFRFFAGDLETFFTAGGCINQTAYVLAANDSDFANAGTGYAVIYHRPQNDCGPEPEIDCYDNHLELQLMSFSGGLNGFIKSNVIRFPLYLPEDMLYAAIRIEYDPATDEWSMYTLVDNSALPEIIDQDNFPIHGLIQSGVQNSQYTDQPLNYTGPFHSYCPQIEGQGGANALFDDIYILPDASLPVEFSDFRLSRLSNGILIDFQTASEFENDYFVVEKSADGRYFRSITKLQSKGNSLQTRKYSYLDPETANGHFYYRIKQVDFSGAQSFSGIKSISISSNNDNFPIVNTVFQDYIYLQNLNSGPINYRLFDLNGKILLENKIQNLEAIHIEIETSHLPGGLYFLNISGNNQEHSFKLVKVN